jgi:hypothetical protein
LFSYEFSCFARNPSYLLSKAGLDSVHIGG